MIQDILIHSIAKALLDLYQVKEQNISIQKTKKEFLGDFTLVVFPFLKISKKGPEQTAEELGIYLQQNVPQVKDFNVVKGFLNLTLSDEFLFERFVEVYNSPNYGFMQADQNSPIVLVEYSSPNTNKPLHLGHIRNNLLGYSVAEILKASGKHVKKVQIINDRGIHICKSMVAWQDFGNGETPASSGLKGDHLVGKYYVEFDKQYKKEVANLVKTGIEQEIAEKQAPILLKAQSMLRMWEAKELSVMALWEKMNGWVYDGFAVTYKRLGVDFDKNYYESETYLLGKKVVEEGLQKKVFYQKEDGSVWIDLSEDGLDEKLLLRSDQTAVYMTQDIGTAIQRFEDFRFTHSVYTVGNEQDYHFKVLFLILAKLGYDWAQHCYHLSYGMVDLPSGKMKSREGTVVDADDLMEEMVGTAKTIAQELGKINEMTADEADLLYEKVGLGALKYFILKVDPQKRMLFNPAESVDFNGNTGPFIQYTYARIQSVCRKFQANLEHFSKIEITEKEREIMKLLDGFPAIIQEAAKEYSPALVANYIYELVKEYNSYYQSTNILTTDEEEITKFRVGISVLVARVINNGMQLLGIQVPDKM